MVAFKPNHYRDGGAVTEQPKAAPQPEAAAPVAPPAAPEGEKSELQKQLEALQRAEQLAKDRAAQAERERDEARRAASTGDPIGAHIDALPGISAAERDWLKAHPDTITDRAQSARLGAAYYDALDAGHQRGTPEYFQFLEARLGYRNPPPTDEATAEHVAFEPQPESVAPAPPHPTPAVSVPVNMVPETQPEPRRAIVSAPVSRGLPSLGGGPPPRSGTVRLSAEEREWASNSGISETEYARQKLKLAQAKAQGRYGEQG